jgi:FMN-dependent NADH-azoreductase
MVHLQHLKAWSDLAARIGETFRFKPNGRREGLLKIKELI